MSTLVHNPWQKSGAQLLKHFNVKQAKGLTDEQVATQRAEYGINSIPAAEGTSLWKLILQQFEDLMVLILLGAALVSFILALTEESEDRLTAFVEPLVILIILICNATVGVLQETKAESAIEKLKESEANDAIVIRNGAQYTIPAADLVPGDIIYVQEGDKIPADCRILEIKSSMLLTEEPALTGESEPAVKSVDVLEEEAVSNGDKVNLLFSGALCVKGRCTALVIYTGKLTELGKIATDLQQADDDEDEKKTPLQRKLDEFGEQLSKVISVICLLVWIINIGHFNDPIHGGSYIKGAVYYFKIAVALAVAAIPEGLPAVVTTCLAIGAQKMASHGAIVRNLPSVETLGCTGCICSDKTGTLSTGMMTAREVVTVNNVEFDSNRQPNKAKNPLHTYNLLGNSWSPYGQVVEGSDDDTEVMYPSVDVPALAKTAMISALCNEAALTVSEVVDEETHQTKLVFGKSGASTEAALLVLAEKLGTTDDEHHPVAKDASDAQQQNVSIVDSIRATLTPQNSVSYVRDHYKALYSIERLLEFQRQRKSMSVVVKSVKKPSERILLCKGAGEKVLERCSSVFIDGKVSPLTKSLRQQLEQKLEEMNKSGLRSLALAFKQDGLPKATDAIFNDDSEFENIESDMVLVSFVGVLDPPREEVPDAIAKCRAAGIRVVMITGDNQFTAESIAERIGLITPEDRAKHKPLSYLGQDVEKMSESELRTIVDHACIFSRVEHHHKLRIVQALQANGLIVAMGGDGLNDATALRTADIGIAMGSGTSVAKEASKMILQDDNFSTIVMSVEQGRTIYANTKQFIRYLISSNIGEVACIFGTSLLGLPDALIPVQLLWVNLVTDGLPATALGLNPPDSDTMTRKPRSQAEPIIDSWLFIRYIVIGVYVGVGTILGYIWFFLYSQRGPQMSYWALTHFSQCATHPAFDQYITMAKDGSIGGVVVAADTSRERVCEAIFNNTIPSTISLSVLVTIEMFNAMNAISENHSIFVVTPFSNMYVIFATILSFLLHFVILYVPWFSAIFKVAPLDLDEWYITILLSLPVFAIDEILKLISRIRLAAKERKEALKAAVLKKYD